MAFTDFPKGVTSLGIPLIGSGPVLTTGKVRFVSSDTGSADQLGEDPERPLATIDQGINAVDANSSTYPHGDYVIVMQGHSETISAAAGADLDKAGVTVLGLGRGAQRPTITLASDTGADFDVAANGVGLINLLFSATIDSLTSVLDVDAATGVLLESLEFRDTSSVGIDDTVNIADEDDVTIRNCRWYETDTGVGQSCILGTTPTRLVIEDSYFHKDAQTGLVELGNAVDLRIVRNYMETLAAEDLCIVVGSTATGWVDRNRMRLADDSNNVTEAITVTQDLQLGVNWVVNADSERAMEHNATQTTDA